MVHPEVTCLHPLAVTFVSLLQAMELPLLMEATPALHLPVTGLLHQMEVLVQDLLVHHQAMVLLLGLLHLMELHLLVDNRLQVAVVIQARHHQTMVLLLVLLLHMVPHLVVFQVLLHQVTALLQVLLLLTALHLNRRLEVTEVIQVLHLQAMVLLPVLLLLMVLHLLVNHLLVVSQALLHLVMELLLTVFLALPLVAMVLHHLETLVDLQALAEIVVLPKVTALHLALPDHNLNTYLHQLAMVHL